MKRPLNIVICSIIVALACLALVIGYAINFAKSPDLSALEVALNNAGYQLYNPPRGNWGPGFVFSGDIAGGRITNVREVCPNLYGDSEAPQSTEVLLPDFSAKDSVTLAATLRFLKSAFNLDADISKVERERSVEVKWQNIRETSYADMDKWLADGTVKTIPVQCRRAVESLQGRKAFADRVFVIVRAVAPESLTYDFSAAAKAQGSVSAELWKESQAKVQGEGVSTSATQLRVSKRLYVGYAAPVKLSDWIDPGLSSGELIRVRGQPIKLEIAPE